jgi:hypothetical protein
LWGVEIDSIEEVYTKPVELRGIDVDRDVLYVFTIPYGGENGESG